MPYAATRLRQVLNIDSIITIHYFEYMKNFYFKGESHDFWEFVCVDNGVVEIGADDRKYRLRRGDVIFHKPMEFHTIRSINGAPNLLIASFICHAPDMKMLEQQHFSLSSEQMTMLSRLVQEAQAAFSTPIHVPGVEFVLPRDSAPFAAQQMVQAYLELFLIDLIRRRMKEATLQEQRAPAHNRHLTTLQQVVAYLQVHLHETLTVEQICTDNLISRSYLQALFNQEFGCGVIQYFGRMKVDEAKRMIRNGSLHLSQVAYHLGYSSLHYFSRQFKQVAGMSPSQYAFSIKGISDYVDGLQPKHTATNFD